MATSFQSVSQFQSRSNLHGSFGRRFEAGRADLRASLFIFGGLLITATVARALDGSTLVSSVNLREPQMLSAQHSSRPVDHDLLWMGCRTNPNSKGAGDLTAATHCPKSTRTR